MRQRNNLFLGDVNWNANDLHRLELIKIAAVNYPAKVTPSLAANRYMHDLAIELGVTSHSDHASITEGGLIHQLPANVFAGLDFEAVSPNTIDLLSCVALDFLQATYFIEEIRNLNLNFDTPIFDRVRDKFGIQRVLQYFGLETSPMTEHKVIAFLRDVVFRNLEQAFIRKRHVASSPWDFLLHFIWAPYSASSELGDDLQAEKIRMRRRSRGTNPVYLEVKFARHGWVQTSPSRLERKFTTGNWVTRYGLPKLLQLSPGEEVNIPSGGRFDSHEDKDEAETMELDCSEGTGDEADATEVDCDCFKKSILEAPDYMVSPLAKQRVELTFPPDREVGFHEARSLLAHKIKTMTLKRIKSYAHHHAMTSKDVMIGVFYYNQRKHSVLIDGSDGPYGSITDPVEGWGKKLTRSQRTLKKLGIKKFRELYVLNRNKLSTKSRRGLAKRTGLPFLPTLG